MRVRIGPFEIEIDGDAPTLEALARPFEHYRVEPTAEKPFHLHIRRNEPEALRAPEDCLRVAEPRFALSFRPGQANLHYLEPESRLAELPLNVGIMHVLALLALDHDALLVHASAVVERERALVFVGRSGAGKSTLASWFPDDAVLNDDFVILQKKSAERGCAFSQPFYGKSMFERVGRPIGLPVGTLFQLAHGAELRVEPLSPSEAFRTLMSCVALPAGLPGLQAEVLRLAGEWCDEDWRWLQFPLDPEATLRGLRNAI